MFFKYKIINSRIFLIILPNDFLVVLGDKMSAKKPQKLSVSDFIGTKKEGIIGQTSPSKILDEDLLIIQEFDRENLPYNEIDTNELDENGKNVKKQIPYLMISVNDANYQQFRLTPRWLSCFIKAIDFESLDYQKPFSQKAILKGKDAFSIKYEFLNV